MNILIAASYKSPNAGNFIPSLLELSLTLREQQGDVVFVFPKSEQENRQDSWCQWLRSYGFVLYFIDKNAPDDVLYAELLEIIQKHKIDILHTHFGLYNKVIQKYCHKLPVKCLIHDHFGLSVDGKKRIKQIIRNVLLSAFYRLRGIGVAAVNREASKTFPFARTWYVPNGLSRLRNTGQSKTREQTRRLMGIGEDERLCLILGWSLDIKGLDIAVKAVAQCREYEDNISLCIVGFGTAPKEKVLDYISRRTDVDPRAPWIRYWEDTEDIFSYHRAVDVYLSCSRTEGFPYGVLEAISQNTPVVLSDIKGTRWAQSYDYGYTYPVEDPAACARCIRAALQGGAGASNYETVIEKYDIKTWCQSILSIYEKLS